MIEVGTKVRDTLTGFTGIAVCRNVWMYGFTQIGIQSTELHEGKPRDVVYFDERQVESVGGDSADA